MIEKLRGMLKHKPFVPFVIVLTNGQRYEVSAPNMVALGQSQLHYCFPRTDRLAHIALNQVAALETLQRAA
jgi:hypothetical protein